MWKEKKNQNLKKTPQPTTDYSDLSCTYYLRTPC